MRWPSTDELPVGTLVYSDGVYRFKFGQAWLADGIDLSPRLANRTGLLGPWLTLPGVFSGSLPDHWGRFVMDRRALKLGVHFT